MAKKKQKTKSEIEARLNACHQELAAYDYTARKILWELVGKVRELLPPEAELPMADKYAAIEATAEERRQEIRDLEAELPDAPDDEHGI